MKDEEQFIEDYEDYKIYECPDCGGINECWCEYYENDMDERFAP